MELLFEQVDKSVTELLGAGRGSAWRLDRRNTRVWCRLVGVTTRPRWLID